MPIELRCSSRRHVVRLRDDRVWRRALCPKCKTHIDPTRLRRLWIILRGKLINRSSKSAIPDEIRFANLRWRIDRLAGAAWTSDEGQLSDFNLYSRKLDRLGPEAIVREYLGHIRKIAPRLPVPIKIPEIVRGRLKDAGGAFSSRDGWAVMTLSDDLVADERAVRAVLAHEVCHYVLNCSGMREEETESNEKLTDLCMFVLGLGNIYLEGYRSATVKGEYRIGHRLGYLKDNEYRFAQSYVWGLRSDADSAAESGIRALRTKILARVGDERVVDRLIESEWRRTPNKSQLEVYQSAYESLDRGRA